MNTYPHVLQEAHSMDQVVAAINSNEYQEYFGGVSSYTSEQLAAYYALDCCEYGGDSDEIEAHLDIISDFGATFDATEALAVAQTLSLH